ncbi:hypothetical protein Tco_1431565 [Tanacetum coccineum]
MCKHSPPAELEHPEIPERIPAIWNKLESAGIPQSCEELFDIAGVVRALRRGRRGGMRTSLARPGSTLPTMGRCPRCLPFRAMALISSSV